MKFVPKSNKKNGSQYWTLNALVDRFYTSRFNRDNMHDPAVGEDIDNSRLYRIYNKRDVKELLHIFFDFFEWVINEENLGKIYLTDNLTLVRESKMPTIRRANIVDVLRSPDRAKEGELYVSRGKYLWTLFFSGEAFSRMRDLQFQDPEFKERYDSLEKEANERNRIEKENGRKKKNDSAKSQDKPIE